MKNVYFLKQGNVFLTKPNPTDGGTVPHVYFSLSDARKAASEQDATLGRVVIVHYIKGFVGHVTPFVRYGVKHQNECFTFAFREFDVSAAWALIEKNRETKTISTDSMYNHYLKDNDFDFNAESNWSEPNDRGGRRMIKMPSVLGITIDIKKAMSDEVDYSVPLLVAPIFANGKFAGHVVIDGWHRAYKAYKQGVKELPAFVLTDKEAKKITRT